MSSPYRTSIFWYSVREKETEPIERHAREEEVVMMDVEATVVIFRVVGDAHTGHGRVHPNWWVAGSGAPSATYPLRDV